jgi:hypothetical protein
MLRTMNSIFMTNHITYFLHSFLYLDMSKIFSIDPQTGNNYQGDEQTVTNVMNKIKTK